MESSSIFTSRLFPLAILSLASIWAAPSQAETTNCTAITSLPVVITSQGVYCFTGHLTTGISSGSAIDIQANNVTIDMNGFKLGGQAAGIGTDASGIEASDRRNITIRNGIIRGFLVAIDFDDSDNVSFANSWGHLVENILADSNTETGIWMEGHGITIRGNTVVNTGGSTISTNSYGIAVKGPGNDVLNNRVAKTTADSTGSAYGIFLENADTSVVQGNRVGETTATGTGTGSGILMYQSNDVTSRDNIVSTADFGVSYDSGGTGSSGKYMGNITNNISSFSFVGGTAVGTNN